MSEFLSLVYLYGWTLVAAAFSSVSLSQLGCHLAARDRAMQTVCVGQGAALGVLLGLAAGYLFGQDISALGTFVPTLTGMGTAFFTSILAERLGHSHLTSRNTAFASLFAVLTASGYLVSSVFPALDSHLSQVYFGELTTLNELEARASTALALVVLFCLCFWHRKLTRDSFDIAVFGSSPEPKARGLFQVLSLGALTLSVQGLGFLFTIGFLFLPTVLLAGPARPGLRRHFTLAAVLALLGALGGFFFSLIFPRYPTVPSMILLLTFLATLLRATGTARWLHWEKRQDAQGNQHLERYSRH